MKIIINRGAFLACLALFGMSAHATAGENAPKLPDCPSLSQPMLPAEPPASAKALDITQAVDLLQTYKDIYSRHLKEMSGCVSMLNAIDDAIPTDAPITSAYVTSKKERSDLRIRVRMMDLDEKALIHHLARAVSDRSTPEARHALAGVVMDAAFDDSIVDQARHAERAFEAAMDRRFFLLLSITTAREKNDPAAIYSVPRQLIEARQKGKEALEDEEAFRTAMGSFRHTGIGLPTSAHMPPHGKDIGPVTAPPPPPPPPRSALWHVASL